MEGGRMEGGKEVKISSLEKYLLKIILPLVLLMPSKIATFLVQ